MLDFEIKQHREKRSNDANAYFHVLVNKMARVFGTSDEEMKIQMNLKYGAIARDTDGKIVAVKIPKKANIRDFYNYAKWYGECEENGIKLDKYLFYKETHTLDTKEMSDLIYGVVQECLENKIEVRPESEIKSMIESWGK